MPALYTTIGPWTLQTFTLAVGVAIIASAGLGLWRVRRADSSQVGFFADAYLAALVGGMVGARLFHVLLNFDYFGENLNEAPNLALGGLDWHGAVIGGLVGLYAAVWWRWNRGSARAQRAAPLQYLLNSLTLALPIIGLGGWYGCLAGGCGYGKEVDTLANYSSLAASELADVFGIVAPRYNTQWFGMALCAVVLLVVVVLYVWEWRTRSIVSLQIQGSERRTTHSESHTKRFWFILALLSTGMFVIGFFRGDHVVMLLGVRGDQLLDIGLFVVSCWLLVKRSQETTPHPHPPAPSPLRSEGESNGV